MAVRGASAWGLTGGRLTSQYACSWQSMTMRSPFRRCLAALSMAKAAPVPHPHRFPRAAVAPASAQPQPCLHPGAVSALHSPELLPRLHDHEVPRVVDPLVQEVVVVLGSSGRVATASQPCPALPWPWGPQHGDHCTRCSSEHWPLLGELSTPQHITHMSPATGRAGGHLSPSRAQSGHPACGCFSSPGKWLRRECSHLSGAGKGLQPVAAVAASGRHLP